MRQRNETILADLVANRADEVPDHVVVTFEGAGVRPDENRTYADLWINANRIASGLIAKGMEKGDRFGLLLLNHPEFIECMIAASITGCVFVPIDPRTRGEKLAYTLKNSECRGIVCGDYSLAQVAEVRPQLPDLAWMSVLESGEQPDVPATRDVPDATPLAAWLDVPEIAVDVRVDGPGDSLEIIYTSGTTGDPKGIVCSNERYCGAVLIGFLTNFAPEERLYTGLSLTHGNAQLITLAPTLGMRLHATFSRKFTKSRLWDITRKYDCTVFNLLGGMATAVYSEPQRPDDADNPVRFVVSSGMPIAIWEAFEKRFGVQVLECYGAVEGGIAVKPIGEGPIGSFGKPPATLEMRIVDEEGNDCPPGVCGELISRPATGENAEVEYYKNADASEKKTKGGWLRSGDICHRDEDGWYFFDYRKGGGIRHNGDFIHPGFVEKVLAEHPQVTDVFVYGVSAASGAPGEKDVVAAIVPVDAATLDANSVFATCRAGLESNFVPSFLQVVDEIPKTASEKPQERLLLRRFAPDGEGIFRAP